MHVVRALSCAAVVSVSTAHADVDPRPYAYEMGITPISVTNAGFGTSEAEMMLGRIVEATTLRAAVDDAATNLEESMSKVASLKRAYLADPGDEDVASALVQVKSAIEQQRAARDAALKALRLKVVEGLDMSSVSTMLVCASSMHRRSPAETLVLEQGEAKWRKLQSAYVAVARADRRGEESKVVDEQVISDAESDPDVMTSKAALLQKLQSVESVFKNAVDPD